MNKKYAVCIGNNYPGSGNDLSGCVNDAYDWGNLLASLGYEVTTIIEATKADMVGALTELVARAGFGDRGVFTYSGHGTWVPDRNGDEPDARDEALVPTDFRQGYLLLDDELDIIFRSKRYGAGMLMLSDSCHSGSVSRVFDVSHLGKPRFLPPSQLGRDLPSSDDHTVEARADTPAPLNTSLISGCGDLEYSYDAWFGERANGAFTRAAIDTHQQYSTLNAWFTRIRQALPSDMYPQSPQLTAATSYRKYVRAL